MILVFKAYVVEKLFKFDAKTFLSQKMESFIISLRNIYTGPLCRSSKPPLRTIPATFWLFVLSYSMLTTPGNLWRSLANKHNQVHEKYPARGPPKNFHRKPRSSPSAPLATTTACADTASRHRKDSNA